MCRRKKNYEIETEDGEVVKVSVLISTWTDSDDEGYVNIDFENKSDREITCSYRFVDFDLTLEVDEAFTNGTSSAQEDGIYMADLSTLVKGGLHGFLDVTIDGDEYEVAVDDREREYYKKCQFCAIYTG